MLDFCPLCMAEVYALRRDAMRAGTSRYPLHRPTTTYYLCCKDMLFFSRVMTCLPTEMIAEPSDRKNVYLMSDAAQNR